MTTPAKPTVNELGVDVSTLVWRRSSKEKGAMEVAFTQAGGQEWVLMRVSDDPDERVSVFSRWEWDCFLDGVRNGEFDAAS